jgi:uroporphyrinogen-III decarboxylase
MAHCHYWKSPEPAVESLADARRICVPDKGYYTELGWADRQRRIMSRAGDNIAIIGDCNSATLAFYETLRGMDQAMFDLIDEPELVHAVMDKGLAIAIEKGKFNIDLGLRILRLNDSIANMSVISPEHWRQFIKPRITEFCTELHQYEPAVRIYCHICGNVLPVLADLVETGLDCIAPLDPLGGFTCGQARETVGQSVALMGGINTLSFLDKSPEGIAQEARDCMSGAGLHGGFILGSGCVVPRDAKVDTILAAAEAARRFGTYRNGSLYQPDDQDAAGESTA